MTDETPILPTTAWVLEQTQRILANGSTEGVEVYGKPVVLLAIRGARSGLLRWTPLMRVEHEGRYGLVASKGGADEHPAWFANLLANPDVSLQDGSVTRRYTVREVHGAERDGWWERAVAAYPPYAEYQTRTSRTIPVLVCEPAGSER
jgi:deazaflavin-dependent oxidoreductase (nitroreductase family)